MNQKDFDDILLMISRGIHPDRACALRGFNYGDLVKYSNDTLLGKQLHDTIDIYERLTNGEEMSKMKEIKDVLQFAIILGHIGTGQTPQAVCETMGTSFPALRSYAEDHALMEDLMQAISLGADALGEEECQLADRGECTTCSE